MTDHAKRVAVTTDPTPLTYPVLCYVVDAANTIREVSGAWDDAARSQLENDLNDGRVLADSVVGRPLLTFIQDDATRMLMHTVMAAVRLMQIEKAIDYRCDSPREKRFMRMRVVPLAQGAVQLCHELLRAEPLAEPFVIFSVASHQPHYRRCSLCNRVEVEGAWCEPDTRLPQMLTQPVPIFHTLCPLCAHRMEMDAGAE